MPAVESGLQRGALVMQPADNQFTRRGGLQSKEVPLATMQRHVGFCVLRVLRGENLTNQKSEWSEWDERHGRQRREVAVECGGRRRDTNLKLHLQHPVQKQVRPVPNRRLEQRSCIRRRHLFEGVVVIVPAPGMANRKHSTDRTFRLVHVHNVRRHHHRHDVGDAVKNRLTNLRR